jgi:hypothetical protein
MSSEIGMQYTPVIVTIADKAGGLQAWGKPGRHHKTLSQKSLQTSAVRIYY